MISEVKLYREVDFKETPTGKIPKDWEVVKMDNVAYVKGRIGWRGLKASEYTTEGPYLIANKHLVNNKVIWDKCDHLSEFRYEESSEIQLQINDIIISKDGTIGQPAFIEFLPDRATINSTMMLLRITNNILEPKFLFYFLQGPHFRRFLKQKISGTSIPHLFQRDMKEFRILLPSVEEQKRIVGVLGVVDSAILKVDEVIWKTERLKKGLMQQLLTRGIGHKEYKYSKELRREIPNNWEVKTLLDAVGGKEDSIVAGPFGSNLKVVDYRDKGVPIIRLQNIEYGRFINKDIKYISLEKAEELRYHSFLKGDIVLAKLGAPIGKTCIVPDFLERGIVVADVVRIRVNEQFLNKKYAMYILNSFYVSDQLNRETIGTTRPRVNLGQVRNLFIPIPSLPEQQKISEALSGVDEKSELEKKEKEKLESVRQGLMDLLLTGKVRIKVD